MTAARFVLRLEHMSTANVDDRGRSATRPWDLPRSGWRDVLLRVKDEVREDNMSIVAAGVAFFGFLAIFPGVSALVSIYGLVADPATVAEQLARLRGVLPEGARSTIEDQVSWVASQPSGALSIGLVLGLLATLWSANKGAKAMLTAVNIAYEETDRSFLKHTLVGLALTLGAILVVLILLGLIVAVPVIVSFFPIGAAGETAAAVARIAAAIGVMIFSLFVLYKIGPNRVRAQGRWALPGALAGSVLWLLGSIAFSFFVERFGSYNETYGSLGAAVVLMLWFYLTSYAILLGAEINSELEHQTKRDTTVGDDKPMGQRGAYVADNLGRVP